ncbi:MAG: aminopeptidase [Pseudomonadota bacterium]
MDETTARRFADVLWWGLEKARTGKYRKGDVILVRFDLPALAVAEQLQARILARGMNPVLRMSQTPAMELTFYERADDRQLTFHAPGEKELFEAVNGSIYLHAPESLTHLGHVDPARMGKAAISRKIFRDILDRREMTGEFGWTLGIVPTRELARQARTTLAAYSRQWAAACFLDDPEPVARWEEIFARAGGLKQWLNSMAVTKLKIESENVDLVVTPGQKRQWIGISGHNIPSFEVFLSPDHRGTEGTYYADQPSFRSGNYVAGVRLEFSRGRVVKATAVEGEDFLKKQIDMDRGAARVGEFSLTDKRFSRINRFMANTLFDENYGGKYGNCHLALGSSYADTFAGNQEDLDSREKKRLGFNDSALHWDLVNTEKKTVTAWLASGEKRVIYKDGLFQGP